MKMFYEKDTDVNLIKDKKIMYILVHHTDDTLKESWDNRESDLQQQELDMFDCRYGDIIIQEMTPVFRPKKIKK